MYNLYCIISRSVFLSSAFPIEICFVFQVLLFLFIASNSQDLPQLQLIRFCGNCLFFSKTEAEMKYNKCKGVFRHRNTWSYIWIFHFYAMCLNSINSSISSARTLELFSFYCLWRVQKRSQSPPFEASRSRS